MIFLLLKNIKSRNLRPVKGRKLLPAQPPYYSIRVSLSYRYTLLLTWEIRPRLLSFPILGGDSGVIFLCFLLAPGFHPPRFALTFEKQTTVSFTVFDFYNFFYYKYETYRLSRVLIRFPPYTSLSFRVTIEKTQF